MFNFKQKKELEIKLFDSICHLDDPVFDRDRDALFEKMRKVGIEGVLIAGITQDKWRLIRQLAALKKNVYAAVGLHPMFLKQHSKRNIRDLELAAAIKPLTAVGEIGLDFYENDIERQAQIELFKAQVEIAKSAKLPLVLHVRKAHEEVLIYLQALNFQEGGIVHAFNGSMEQAKRYIAMGFKLSFGGAMTYPHAVRLRELVKLVPLESMVLETNSPDMKPISCKKEHNTPLNLFDIFNEICKLREEPAKLIADTTRENSKTALRIT